MNTGMGTEVSIGIVDEKRASDNFLSRKAAERRAGGNPLEPGSVGSPHRVDSDAGILEEKRQWYKKVLDQAKPALKTWADNQMFWRVKDPTKGREYYAGMAVGSALTVGSFAYLGPMGGAAKSALIFAGSQVIYQGVRLHREHEINEIRKTQTGPEMSEKDVQKKIDDVERNHARAADRVRRFCLGVSVAGFLGGAIGSGESLGQHFLGVDSGTTISQGVTGGGTAKPATEIPNKVSGMGASGETSTATATATVQKPTITQTSTIIPTESPKTTPSLTPTAEPTPTRTAIPSVTATEVPTRVSPSPTSVLPSPTEAPSPVIASPSPTESPSPTATLEPSKSPTAVPADPEKVVTPDVSAQIEHAKEVLGDSKGSYSVGAQSIYNAQRAEVVGRIAQLVIDKPTVLENLTPDMQKALLNKAIQGTFQDISNTDYWGTIDAVATSNPTGLTDELANKALGNYQVLLTDHLKDTENVGKLISKAQVMANNFDVFTSNPGYVQEVQGTVGAHLGKTTQMVEKVLADSNMSINDLKTGGYGQAKLAVQHQLEDLSNRSFAHGAADVDANPAKLKDAISKGKGYFEADLKNSDYSARLYDITKRAVLEARTDFNTEVQAAVVAQMDQSDKIVNEYLADKGLDSTKVSRATFEEVRKVAQNELSLNNLQTHREMVAFLEAHQPKGLNFDVLVHNTISSGQVVQVPIRSGDNFGQLLVNNGYDLTSWGPEKARLFGVHLALDYDIFQDGYLHQMGNLDGFPKLEEISDLVRKAEVGDNEAIKKLQVLKNAMGKIQAGGKALVVKKDYLDAVAGVLFGKK